MEAAQRQQFVEGHLGFRIVDMGGNTGAQMQRLDEEGKVKHVAPANPRELTMFKLLCTPEKEWG